MVSIKYLPRSILAINKYISRKKISKKEKYHYFSFKITSS